MTEILALWLVLELLSFLDDRLPIIATRAALTAAAGAGLALGLAWLMLAVATVEWLVAQL